MGSTTLISSAFTALLQLQVEVGRRNRIQRIIDFCPTLFCMDLWHTRRRSFTYEGEKMVLPNFKENLEKYAKLLVANGINVQPGHTFGLEHRCGNKENWPT